LKKDEVLILLAQAEGRWNLWVYPATANLAIAEQLMNLASLQLKQVNANKIVMEEKNRADRNRSVYMV